MFFFMADSQSCHKSCSLWSLIWCSGDTVIHSPLDGSLNAQIKSMAGYYLSSPAIMKTWSSVAPWKFCCEKLRGVASIYDHHYITFLPDTRVSLVFETMVLRLSSCSPSSSISPQWRKCKSSLSTLLNLHSYHQIRQGGVSLIITVMECFLELCTLCLA